MLLSEPSVAAVVQQQDLHADEVDMTADLGLDEDTDPPVSSLASSEHRALADSEFSAAVVAAFAAREAELAAQPDFDDDDVPTRLPSPTQASSAETLTSDQEHSEESEVSMLEADCNQSEDEQSLQEALQHNRRPLKRNRGRYDKPQANARYHSWSSDEEPEPDQEPAMALDNLDDRSEEEDCNQNDGDPSVQLDPALPTATPSVPPAETEREFASWVCAEFAAHGRGRACS